jgi:hypothetical protein
MGSYTWSFGSVAQIYDGEYVRSSDTDFPNGAGFPIKGAGLLQTLRSKSGSFAYETVDTLINTSGGNQTMCTVFFFFQDGWSGQSGYLQMDWFEINSAAGGSGNLYLEPFDSAITMERTGTTGDYGYISTGDVETAITKYVTGVLNATHSVLKLPIALTQTLNVSASVSGYFPHEYVPLWIAGVNYDYVIGLDLFFSKKAQVSDFVSQSLSDIDPTVWVKKKALLVYTLRVTDYEKWTLDQLLAGHQIINVLDGNYSFYIDAWLSGLRAYREPERNWVKPWRLEVSLIALSLFDPEPPVVDESDFLNWIEYDTGNYLTITSSRCTWIASGGSHTNYLSFYHVFSSDYILDVDARITDSSYAGSIELLVVSDSISWEDIFVLFRTFAMFFDYGSGDRRIHLVHRQRYPDNLYFGSGYPVALNTTYYLRLRRLSGILSLQIFSDAARTNLLHTETSTVNETRTAYYKIVTMSHAPYGQNCAGYVENFVDQTP